MAELWTENRMMFEISVDMKAAVDLFPKVTTKMVEMYVETFERIKREFIVMVMRVRFLLAFWIRIKLG